MCSGCSGDPEEPPEAWPGEAICDEEPFWAWWKEGAEDEEELCEDLKNEGRMRKIEPDGNCVK